MARHLDFDSLPLSSALQLASESAGTSTSALSGQFFARAGGIAEGRSGSIFSQVEAERAPAVQSGLTFTQDTRHPVIFKNRML